MENIIEAAVRKEVARQQQQEEVVNKAPKKKVVEKRMSNLLTRICNNTSSSSSATATPVEKPKKVNVKWKRFSPLTGQSQTVSAKKGGGHRFINLTSTDTLDKVMEQAISIFFSIEGRNSFGEHYSTCTFQLTDQTGEHVQLSQTLQDFQSLKNIYLSKMYFVLQSTLNEQYSFEYLTDSTLNFSTPLIRDGDGSLEVSQDSFSLSEDLPGFSRASMPEDLGGPSRAPLPEDLPGPSRAPMPEDLSGRVVSWFMYNRIEFLDL